MTQKVPFDLFFEGKPLGQVVLDLAPDYTIKTLGGSPVHSPNRIAEMKASYQEHKDTAKFLVIAVALPDVEGFELIINSIQNAEEKIRYYEQVYDSKTLVHKHNPGISIVHYEFITQLNAAAVFFD